MARFQFSSTTLVIVVLACGSVANDMAQASEAEEQVARAVRVRLVDGRILVGTVNERTNEDQLWLHFHHPNMQLSASFGWEQVQSGVYFGRTLNAEELYRLAFQLRTSEPAPPPFHPLHGADVSPFRLESKVFGSSDDPFAPSAGRRRHPSARVANLSAVARLGTWDHDAAIDGLRVMVRPLSIDGQLLAVDGTLTAELYAAVRPIRESEQPRKLLGRWSQQLSSKDFGTDGASVRLRLNQRGDRWLAYPSSGRLQLRLGVPGQGNFATHVPVSLHNHDPYRDHLHLHSR